MSSAPVTVCETARLWHVHSKQPVQVKLVFGNILLLVSWNFLASDYCISIELGQAIDRHKEGTSRVIPVILNECPWKDTPVLEDLELLPEDGKAFDAWDLWSQALNNIYEGIKQAIKELQSAPEQAKEISAS